jgi:alanyl-tRNA synthetase
MSRQYTGAEIRQLFIDFFVEHGHTFVPSSSLVPGGDSTLLFTNAGMVQFKDVFLGTDNRPYSRAANSQKCMRVAGKHNDLEDVGRDDTHHTFFEMLGNWSFGDYYKKEAITWAWQLLTEVWGLDHTRLYATVFRDDKGEIPTDEEAVTYWKQQPGFNADHIIYLGRKDNFWEMAETGPCGPNSEIHYDLGSEHGELEYREDGQVDLDNGRFVELWNLVFMQFNRTGPDTLEPLPDCHVDTGLGFDRIVAALQNKRSNYRTDLFWPIILEIQNLAGHTDEERESNFTPYRVIADHARAATFLIADGVVPGNLGRNYITRMIIRRAARFGTKIGLTEPFLATIANSVIDIYGSAYPELEENQTSILDNLTREEERFQRTVESGITHLENLLKKLVADNGTVLDGEEAFDLYATYGLPLEITRDIAQERSLDVDEVSFKKAMEAHRIASGAGQALGQMGVGVEFYSQVAKDLQITDKLSPQGVKYYPYESFSVDGEVLALIRDGQLIDQANVGDQLEIVLPQTCFYIASGGQVSDHGIINSPNGEWEIRIRDVIQPAAGLIVHQGEVAKGTPRAGDTAYAVIDRQRRQDIMRNHTATHLLHSALHNVIGEHARQAGSLVAPDRLRFDFTHSEALTKEQITQIEAHVNRNIYVNHDLHIEFKSLEKARQEGAIAIFGEKYESSVRTIKIGDEEPFSYELCGGTHVENTSDIGIFLITSEGSTAAGIRRIEAITGREAFAYIQNKRRALDSIAELLKTAPDKVVERTQILLDELNIIEKELAKLRLINAIEAFNDQLEDVPLVQGVPVLTSIIPEADKGTLRKMADRYRQKYPSGVAIFASVSENRPFMIATVTEDLTERGLHAGNLVKMVAQKLGGGGGGRPTMAEAGGKDASKLQEAMEQVEFWVKQHLQ